MYVVINGDDLPPKLQRATARSRVVVSMEFDVEDYSHKAQGGFSVSGIVRDMDVRSVRSGDGQNPYIKKANADVERMKNRSMGSQG